MLKPAKPVSLAELLKPEAINLNIQSRQKIAALREVASLLAHSKAINNFDAFFREILERERVSNTALGHHVAIPHARTDQCSEIVVAVGRNLNGVDFESRENGDVQLIFLIGTPKQMVTEYLRVVGNLARLLRRDDIREQLLQAPDPATFIRIIAEAEAGMS
ncbi:MAG: PTS sugar transporter subunit IIA [Verrucomicrobiae bacterium]|nr:PTS sugar transporter subunit IIA [Verrucomicrobiae bacterium]